MINFYEKMPNNLKRENKLDRNFRKHHILPTSMICVIGGAGSGKSNGVANMISHQSGKSYYTKIRLEKEGLLTLNKNK